MVSQIKLPQKDEGYLIRSVDYSEDHRILSFLTRNDGRLDMIALGAKKSLKRFGPALDFLNRLQLDFEWNSKGGLHRLLQVDLVGSHLGVRDDYERTWTALEWLKLLSMVLKEEGPVSGLFEILDQNLTALDRHPGSQVDQSFRCQLLACLGYSLELTQCARCHAKTTGLATFVAREGGLLCGACHVPQASEVRARFFSSSAPDPTIAEQRRVVLDEALAYYLAIPPPKADRQRGEKTTRNHSQRFRVVGRKVGGLKKEKID